MSEPLSIELCALSGETSTYIEAEILENGDLRVSGQDIGKAPQEHFGDSDYEYWLTVPGEHKDRLLLALLYQLYQDDSCAVSKLTAILEAAAIPHEFDSYA